MSFAISAVSIGALTAAIVIFEMVSLSMLLGLTQACSTMKEVPISTVVAQELDFLVFGTIKILLRGKRYLYLTNILAAKI